MIPDAIRDRVARSIEEGVAVARRTGKPARFVLMEALRDVEEHLIARASRQRSNAAALATLRVAREWGLASDSCRRFPLSRPSPLVCPHPPEWREEDPFGVEHGGRPDRCLRCGASL